MRVLVVNAGSSSLKLRVLDDCRQGDRHRGPARAARCGRCRGDRRQRSRHSGDADAVGPPDRARRHARSPARSGSTTVCWPALRALTGLAPLHQPKSWPRWRRSSGCCPACRAWRASTPPSTPRSRPRPPPTRCRASGASAGRCGATDSTGCPTPTARAGRRNWLGAAGDATLRIVTCHLGAGASLAAVRGGVSVDTTMGFTPLEGLVMATRSGSVDPGLVLWLAEHAGMPPAELAATLEHRSGLLGLAGTADMREVVAARQRRASRTRGSRSTSTCTGSGPASRPWPPPWAAWTLLVFTGGVGENSPEVAVGGGGRARLPRRPPGPRAQRGRRRSRRPGDRAPRRSGQVIRGRRPGGHPDRRRGPRGAGLPGRP